MIAAVFMAAVFVLKLSAIGGGLNWSTQHNIWGQSKNS
jgi:hypothetical protein